MISFFVPAVPIAQPRQRHAIIAGHVRNYTPTAHPVTAFKATCRLASRQAFVGGPMEGPLYLKLLFLMPRPGRLRWKRRPMPREWHTSKPDLDNLEKSIKDALTGTVWIDDAQVCSVEKRKLYCRGDEQPGVCVEVERIREIVEVLK